MKHLTIEQLSKIGEAVSRELPVTTVLEWDYRLGRKSDFLNFRMKSQEDIPENEQEAWKKILKEFNL